MSNLSGVYFYEIYPYSKLIKFNNQKIWIIDCW